MLFLTIFHKPFWAMKPPTSNSFLPQPFAFLPGDPSFRPSIFHPLAFVAGTLASSSIGIRFLPILFRVDFLRLASIHQSFSVSIDSSHNVVSSQVCVLLHLPSMCLESSRSHFGPSHLPCKFMRLLPPHLIGCCRTPLRTMLPCFAFLFPKVHFSFGLDLSSSQSFIRQPHS